MLNKRSIGQQRRRLREHRDALPRASDSTGNPHFIKRSLAQQRRRLRERKQRVCFPTSSYFLIFTLNQEIAQDVHVEQQLPSHLSMVSYFFIYFCNVLGLICVVHMAAT